MSADADAPPVNTYQFRKDQTYSILSNGKAGSVKIEGNPGLPSTEPRAPVDVRCNVKIIKLFGVNDSANVFSIDFILTQTWRDENFREIPRLRRADKDGREYERKIDWERHWYPQWEFTNEVDIMFVKHYTTRIDQELVAGSTEGLFHTRVMRRTRFKGSFYEHFELKSFPFDIQSLTVGIRARKGTNSMIFRSPVTHGPEFVGTKFMLPEWEFITLVPFVRIQYSKLFGKALAKTEAKLERKKKEESARESAQLDARAARKSEHIANDPMLKAQGSFENPLGGAVQDDLAVVKVKKKRKWKKSLFTFNLPISRRDGYYLVNVVPLNCLIVLLGWTAFAMEPDVIDQRLTVVFTMLLTSTAFKFVYADSLPRIDYVTLLDAYMYSALVMLLLQAIEHVYAIHQIVPFHDGNSNTTWAEHKKSMDDLIIQERVILGCLIATWTSIHLFIAWHVISHRKFQKPYSFPNQVTFRRDLQAQIKKLQDREKSMQVQHNLSNAQVAEWRNDDWRSTITSSVGAGDGNASDADSVGSGSESDGGKSSDSDDETSDLKSDRDQGRARVGGRVRVG